MASFNSSAASKEKRNCSLHKVKDMASYIGKVEE